MDHARACSAILSKPLNERVLLYSPAAVYHVYGRYHRAKEILKDQIHSAAAPRCL